MKQLIKKYLKKLMLSALIPFTMTTFMSSAAAENAKANEIHEILSSNHYFDEI